MQSKVLHDGQKGGSLEAPAYTDLDANLAPFAQFTRRPVWPSKMFTIKLELSVYLAANPGAATFDASQGDGGASLGGVPREELAAALQRYLPAECTTKYGDPVGRADVRKAILQNYCRLDAATTMTPNNIVICDGGRDGLQKWYQLVAQTRGCIGGNIVVSAAPWGSYSQGTYVNALNLMRAPGSADEHFEITPQAVDACLERSKADGRELVGLIITTPDNPTGHYMPAERIVALVEHAVSRGIPHVFVDMVYQAVTDPEVGLYDLNAIFKQLSPEARQRTCFMDSLTKSAGGSNLRVAHLLVANNDFVERLKGISTHTVIPNAIGEAAALEVYGHENPTQHPWMRRIVGPTAESRAIVRARLTERDFRFIADQGYYAFINIWPWLGKRFPDGQFVEEDGTGRRIERAENVEVLKSYMTTRRGLAVVHGSIFKQPDFIRFSYANAPAYTEGALKCLFESLDALTD